jgi:hypothetical protein
MGESIPATWEVEKERWGVWGQPGKRYWDSEFLVQKQKHKRSKVLGVLAGVVLEHLSQMNL